MVTDGGSCVDDVAPAHCTFKNTLVQTVVIPPPKSENVRIPFHRSSILFVRLLLSLCVSPSLAPSLVKSSSALLPLVSNNLGTGLTNQITGAKRQKEERPLEQVE